MAYEIAGINPSHSFGDEITLNVFHWPPIMDYCRTVASDIMDKVPDWLSNDGQGLQHQDAVELGRLLLASLPPEYRRHFWVRLPGGYNAATIPLPRSIRCSEYRRRPNRRRPGQADPPSGWVRRPARVTSVRRRP